MSVCMAVARNVNPGPYVQQGNRPNPDEIHVTRQLYELCQYFG